MTLYQNLKKYLAKLKETDYFKDKYLEYYNLEKYCIIGTILLFVVQTSVPKYKLLNPKTMCSLSSIEGRDGINYIACILKESKVLDYSLDSKKGKKVRTIKEEIIYEKLEEKYYKIIKEPFVKELIKLREDYEKELSENISNKGWIYEWIQSKINTCFIGITMHICICSQ